MSNNIADACTSYMTCGILVSSDINWGAVGAGILLVARLMKDIPDAYDAIRKRIKKRNKKKKKKNVKSKR